MNFFYSQLVQFSKQIASVNILGPVRENSSKFLLKGTHSLSVEDDIQRQQDLIIQDSSLNSRDSFDKS